MSIIHGIEKIYWDSNGLLSLYFNSSRSSVLRVVFCQWPQAPGVTQPSSQGSFLLFREGERIRREPWEGGWVQRGCQVASVWKLQIFRKTSVEMDREIVIIWQTEISGEL